MLVSLRFGICDVCYPDAELPIFLFALSLAGFLFGYYLVRTIYWKQIDSHRYAQYQIDILRLRRFNLALVCLASLLVIYNFAAEGLPPFFSFFGIPTESVNGYGRLKQLLGPLLMVIFVDAFLDVSIKRRLVYSFFGFLCLLLYVTRGGILLMLFQALIVLSIRSSMPKKAIYLVATSSVVIGSLFFGTLGSYRTADAILFAGMHIKLEYQQWPTIYLWIISYISTPLSNLCWIVDMGHFDHITWSSFYQLMPSFWHPPSIHTEILWNDRMVDGVYTYLGLYYLDFSYVGLVLVNVLIGIAAGFGSVANRISRNFLVWSFFLSCIAFIFFWDFFLYLSSVILFGLQAFAQWYFVKELPPRTVTPKLLSQSSSQ